MVREFVAQFRSVGAEKLQGDFKKIGASTKTLDDGLKKVDQSSVRAERRMSELSLSLGTLVRAGAGLAIGRWFLDASAGAGKLEADLRGIGAVIGPGGTADIEAWILKSGDALNISQAAATEAALMMTSYAVEVGKAGGSTTEFTTDMITLAAEIAAFRSVDPGQVVAALGGAMRGEFDTLQTYGINLNAAVVETKALEMGLAASGSELTAQDKTMATYAAAMEQGAFAMGSVARTADTLPGKMADLKQKTKDLSNEVGGALVPGLAALAGVATEVFGVFNKLPGPVKATVIAFAGLAIVKKLIGPSFATLAESMTNMRVEMTKTAGATGKFKAGLSALSGAFNPWTLALTAGIGLLAAYAAKNAEAKAKVDELTGGIDAQTGALNEQGQATLSKMLAGLADDAETAGISMAQLAATVGDQDAYDSMIAKLEAIIKAHSEFESQGRGEAKLRMDETGQAAFDLMEKVQDLNGTYQGARSAAEDVAAGQEAVAAAFGPATTAADRAAAAMAEYESATKEAEAEVKGLVDALDILNNQFITDRDLVVKYEAALDDLAESMKDGSSFSPDSEVGRENWENLVDIAEGASERVRRVAETKGADAAGLLFDKIREQMIQTLREGGASAGEAERIINNVFKKPRTIDIKLGEIDTAQVERDVARLTERKNQIAATMTITGGSAEETANEFRNRANQALINHPINAKITAKMEELETARQDLKELAKPGGKNREAPVNPIVDPASESAYKAKMAELTKAEYKTIYLTTVDAGGGGGRGGGGTDATPPRGGGQNSPTATPTTTRLAPVTKPTVNVYVDGKNIPARADTPRGSGRRVA